MFAFNISTYAVSFVGIIRYMCLKAIAKSVQAKERENITDTLIDIEMKMSFLSNIVHTLPARVSE
jgi:hypothetical protein